MKRLIKNYCFYRGKWFHLYRDEYRRELISSDLEYIKRLMRGVPNEQKTEN